MSQKRFSKYIKGPTPNVGVPKVRVDTQESQT